MSLENYSAMLKEAKQSVDYWQDIALTDFSREVHRRMRKLGITAADLARRMGTSRSYVSQLLDGGNFTLQTMVKIAIALDAVVRLRLEGNEERSARAAAESGVVVDLDPYRRQRIRASIRSEDSRTNVVTASWRG